MNYKEQNKISCPVKTIPYKEYQSSMEMSFLNSDGKRHDGREPPDLCKRFMSVGQISNAKGSSFIESGNTKVICSVYGPKEIQRNIEFKMVAQVCCDVRFTPFSSNSRQISQSELIRKEFSNLLKHAIEAVVNVERYPKSQIDIFFLIIEDGGSTLSTCITAAGLALSNARIEMNDILVGMTIAWHQQIPYADPSKKEETCVDEEGQRADGNGLMTIGMMPKYADGQVVLMLQQGTMSADSISDGTETAAMNCRDIARLCKQVLLEANKEELTVRES